jgi:hypothetical protein
METTLSWKSHRLRRSRQQRPRGASCGRSVAAPEVENDRRALNTMHGMRRARKEGRWMGPAPYGYANKVTEDGRKYIAPKEPQAEVIQWAFN